MSRNIILKTVPCAALAIAVNGCATSGPKSAFDKRNIAVVGHSETHGMDPIAAAAYWGTRFDRNPNDAEIVVAFSKALRAVDNNQEAFRVMNQAQMRIPDNADILLEMGKVFIANDQPDRALRPIEQAIAMGKFEDWSAYSAYGVALDQTGQHKKARMQYDRALGLAPDQAQILNNKGLSYALQGKHDLAELTLQTATANAGGTARMRQNYALVLALGGNTEEAERLARSDLPPTVASNNASYYRSLVAQPVAWQDLSRSDLQQPDFGDDPANVSFTPRSTPVPEPVPSPTPYRLKKDPTPPQEQQGPIQGSPAPSVSASLAPQISADAISAQPAERNVDAASPQADGEPMTLSFENSDS
ncbi:MAG: tetratricopeptide repeat protein [Pseudomonadota bacterium]